MIFRNLGDNYMILSLHMNIIEIENVSLRKIKRKLR